MALTPSRAERPAPLDNQFIRDHVETRGFRLGRPVAPKFAPDGRTILFLRSGPRSAKQALYEFTVETGATRELVTGESLLAGAEEVLSPEEKARRERQRVSVGGLTSFQISKDGTRVLLPFGGKLYLLDRATGKTRSLAVKGAAIDPVFSPDGRRVAYVREHDVWSIDIATGREERATTGGTELIEHGVAEFVAQEEMGRFRGYWWSPDSRSLLFQESDARGVEVWRVPDPYKPDQAPQPQFYPRPGHSNVVVRLGIVPVRGGKPVWIQWDAARYPYLTHADWHERGGLTICVQTRDQRELRLLRVDPRTGATVGMVPEKDSTWVNIDPDMPRWLEDGSGFLWTSERNGGWELELRDPRGNLVRTIVPKEVGWRGLDRLDDARREIWFRAETDSTRTHVWRTSIDGGSARPVTTGPGVHSTEVHPATGAHIVTSTGPSSMARSEVRRADGSVAGVLPSVAEDPDLLTRTEVVSVGVDPVLRARVTRPRVFAEGRKYPVIVDIYGGPHANTVEESMGGWLMPQWLADQGFIVVAIDNRGTPRRGRDWERAIFGKFGSVPVEDQVRGLQALGERFPEMDLKRVGITGWSFGGYMSALAVLRRPDIFRAGVAGAPVTDWFDYDTHYTERYLGVPGAGDTVYPENSLLKDAAGLERPLMLIHGTADDNVFFRHSLKLADALTRAGKRFEFLPLAGFTHMVPEPAMVEQRWQRTVEFFRRELGP